MQNGHRRQSLSAFFLLAIMCLATSTAALSADTIVVGRLTKQATKKCLKDYKVEWVEHRYEVGFIPLQGDFKNPDPSLIGQSVVVTGAPVSAPISHIKHEGPCAEAQMRSDWVEAEGGIRVRRTGVDRLSGLKVSEIKKLEGLRALRTDKGIEVKFINPFKVPLRNLTLRMHYEGCYGKPGHDTVDRRRRELPPGRKFFALFPPLKVSKTNRRGRSQHAARSIQLLGPSDEILFDLDIPIGSLLRKGIECPPRNRRQNR